MADAELNALLARIEDLEDRISLWEARAEDNWVPWEEVKAAAGLPPA